MQDTVTCPHCDRQLNIPENLLGTQVRCPVCEDVFIAQKTVGRQQQEERLPDEPELPRSRRRSRDDYDDDDDDDYDRPRPRRRSRYEDDDYDRPRRRRGEMPHRGGAVLALGIIGLLLSCIPILGWILGGIAVGMGSSDLSAMDRGKMDSEGRGATQGGQICGIIALVISTFSCIGGVWMRLLV